MSDGRQTGSEPFSTLNCLDATKFVLLRVITLKETICPKSCWKSRLKSAKSPLPVNVHGSKTWLLKGTVSRLCACASVICFFLKKTIELSYWRDKISFRTASPAGNLMFIFSSNSLDFRRSLSSYIKIWLAIRKLIAILSLAFGKKLLT